MGAPAPEHTERHRSDPVAQEPTRLVRDDRLALALCEARDTETRFTALAIATADAVRRNPDRKARVQPVAIRLLGDPEPVVRAKAIRALTGLGARDQLDRIRPMLRAADPKERQAAEQAVAALESEAAPK